MSGLYRVSNLVADSMEKKLISYGANIVITPHRETLTISYGGYALGEVAVEERLLDLDAALRAADAVELRANIAVLAPKMLTAARIAGRTVALVGVDWEQELRLKGYWEVIGAFPEAGDGAGMLAGAEAARKLGLAPGQVLNMGGRNMRLDGILRPTGNANDDDVIFVPLSLAQSMAGRPGRASFIEAAALCSGCPIEDIVAQLQAALPDSDVRALAQVAESRMYSVHFAQNLAFSASVVILLTACAMLVMSMLSSVAERRQEIGIMRAVGFSRRNIFAVFVSEAVGIGMSAGVAGYALGSLAGAYILRRLHLAEDVVPAFDPLAFIALLAIAVVTAALSAAFPAWRAGLIEPAEALVSL
jgi:putative ABC transport system permease protein